MRRKKYRPSAITTDESRGVGVRVRLETFATRDAAYPFEAKRDAARAEGGGQQQQRGPSSPRSAGADSVTSAGPGDNEDGDGGAPTPPTIRGAELACERFVFFLLLL